MLGAMQIHFMVRKTGNARNFLPGDNAITVHRDSDLFRQREKFGTV